MNGPVKSWGMGLGAAGLSLSSGLLPTAGAAACTGICGSCGAGCAGLILSLVAGGLIAGSRWSSRQRKEEESPECAIKYEDSVAG